MTKSPFAAPFANRWRADRSMQRAYSRAPSDASAPVCSPPTGPPTCFLCGQILEPEALRQSGLGHALGPTHRSMEVVVRRSAVQRTFAQRAPLPVSRSTSRRRRATSSAAQGGASHELLFADFYTRTAEPKLVRVRRPPTHLIPLLAKSTSIQRLGAAFRLGCRIGPAPSR